MNMTTTYKYISDQMLRVCPLPVESNGIIKLQLTSEHGKTHYMNISPDQFRLIEKVLMGEIK